MATHSSIPAWEIPLTEKGGRLQSIVLQRVRHNLMTKQQQFNQTINQVCGSNKDIFCFQYAPQIVFLGTFLGKLLDDSLPHRKDLGKKGKCGISVTGL